MPGCGDLVAEETGGGAEVEEYEIGIHGVAIFAELAGVTVGVADGEADVAFEVDGLEADGEGSRLELLTPRHGQAEALQG